MQGINIGIIVAGLGIGLMLVGAIVLAAFTWSQRAIGLFDRIANSKYLKRFTGGLMGKLEEYKESAHSTRRAIPEIVALNIRMLDSERARMVFFRLCFRHYPGTVDSLLPYSPVGNRFSICPNYTGRSRRTRIRNNWNIWAST